MLNNLLKLVKCSKWRVFPCKLVREGAKSIKKPCIRTGIGYENASNDLEQIKEWWRAFDATMYGIPTGKMNNIVVLDVDCHSDEGNGFETLMEFVAMNRQIPETLTVSTPSGGLHYYFKNPGHCEIRSSAGKVGPGLDIRGNGGFIVGFMSSNEQGEYKLVSRKLLAEMPDWLVELCLNKEQTVGKCSSVDSFNSFGANEREVVDPRRYAEAVFYNCCSNVAQAKCGTRNNTLFQNAARLYSYSAGGYFSDEMIEDQMLSACITNGLAADKGKSSIIATLKSARNHGYAQPATLKRRIENE